MDNKDYKNVIIYSKVIISNFIKSNMTVVDMTVGNGYDATYLLKYVDSKGFLYGFDIQKEAIENTNEKLIKKKYKNYKLILDSHSYIDKYINSKIDFAIYNLGYLPRANKSITTKTKTTIISLKKLLKMLNKRGMVHIICYPGHEEGKKELTHISNYIEKIDQKKYNITKIKMPNQINNPPVLFVLQKR